MRCGRKSRSSHLLRAVAVACPLLLLSVYAHAADFTLRYIGQYAITTGTLFEGVEFGGISGLDRAPDGTYYAISDDRGGERGTPRAYSLAIDYDADGFRSVTLLRQIFMLRPDATSFSSTRRTVDPESIRVAPNGNLYWSSEGNWSPKPGDRHQPFLREMRVDGSFVRQFSTPAMFDYADNSTIGGRDNKLFESLAVTPNGTIFIATEDAIAQDGPIASVASGSRLRLTALAATGDASAQYVYQLGPIPKLPTVAPHYADNGLVELLALSDSRFLALERGFSTGPGITIRIALADIDGASNVLNVPSLIGIHPAPMAKEYLLDLDVLKSSFGIVLDNLEGMSWGHLLPNGHRTLVLVSDNNFQSNQTTQFIAFELVPRSVR